MSIFQIFSLLSSRNPSLVPAPSQEVLSTIFMYPTLLQLSDVICQQFYVPDPALTFRRHMSAILCARPCSKFQTSYVSNFMCPTLLQLSDVICQHFYVPDPAPTFRRHMSAVLCTRPCSNFQTSYVSNFMYPILLQLSDVICEQSFRGSYGHATKPQCY